MGTQGAVVKGEDLPPLGRLHLITTEQMVSPNWTTITRYLERALENFGWKTFSRIFHIDSKCTSSR